MKLAVLCPQEIPVPVLGYGGIELIAFDFFLELLKEHDTTIFCTPNLRVSTKVDALAFTKTSAIKNYPQEQDLSTIAKEGYEFVFDFTHGKISSKHFHGENYAATCFLTDALSSVNDIFPTKAVRDGFRVDGPVIYPGIRNVYHYTEAKADYLLFLGRISKFKRPDIAVQVANRLGKRISVAGHVGAFSKWPDPTYDSIVKHMCETRGHEFMENPTLEQKIELLRHAQALIVPSDWSMISSAESFGTVCVEALLSGTPVIVSGDGGLKEIVTEECGFVCHTLDDYVSAVKKVEQGAVDTQKCLERGLYFTSERMVRDYLAFASSLRTM